MRTHAVRSGARNSGNVNEKSIKKLQKVLDKSAETLYNILYGV